MSSGLGGVGGFNSGLDINSIISQLISIEHRPIDLMQQREDTIKKQQTAYSNVQSKVNDLLTSIKALTARDFNGKSIFDNLIASSSDATAVSATVTSSATPQTLSVEVKALPTSTVATSTAGVGTFNNATTAADLGITAGNFTIFTKQTSTDTPTATVISVASTDTMSTIMTRIKNALKPDVSSPTVSIVDGKINIDYSSRLTAQVSFGSGSDTSDFLSKTFLNTAIDDGAGTITSSQRITTINLNQAVSSASANIATPVTDGTFSINGVSFDTTGKSLSTIITEINNSSAGVTAAFNKGSNTFQLTSKTAGSTMIGLQNGTSNFLTAMNLISGTDTTSSQVAGHNAEFVLNGTTMYATSATVDETVTGLTGVTLNLNKAQPGTTLQVTVAKDTDSLVKAIKDVVAKYNTAINYIDDQTKVDTSASTNGKSANNGPLAGENSLKQLRAQLRSMFTQGVAGLAGSSYDSLQMVGVSTGAVGSTSGSASATLQLDETKLRAALTANPNNVRKLFIAQDLPAGTPGTDDGFNGTFTNILHYLSDTTYKDGSGNTLFGALYNGGDGSQGLFAAYQGSAQKRISQLDDSIKKAEDRLTIRQQTLQKQFLAMDQLVGQYKNQGSALASISTSGG